MLRLCMLIVVFLGHFAHSAPQQDAFTSDVLAKPKAPSNVLNFAGKKYYFETVFKGNWYQAQQFCNKHGTRLVSITTQAENDRLGKFAEEIGFGHGHFWTSGTNLPDKNGEWVWLSLGNPLTYSNWYPGEPNDQSPDRPENCLEARTIDSKGFSWNNTPCDFSFYFICEAPLEKECSSFLRK